MAAILIFRYQGFKVMIRSNQQNDIKSEFFVSQNPRNYLLGSIISQIIKVVFKMAHGGHFEFGL